MNVFALLSLAGSIATLVLGIVVYHGLFLGLFLAICIVYCLKTAKLANGCAQREEINVGATFYFVLPKKGIDKIR